MLIGRPAVNALATGEDWRAPWSREDVPSMMTQLLAGIPNLAGLRLMPGRRAETAIVLAMTSDDRETVATSLAQAQQRLAGSNDVLAAVDSIELIPARVSNTTA